LAKESRRLAHATNLVIVLISSSFFPVSM
jgi:hypothetical protein